MMMCGKCRTTGHKRHTYQKAEVVAVDLSRCLEQATSSALRRADELQAALDQQDADSWQFKAGLETVETSVKHRTEQTKSVADVQVSVVSV